MAMNEMVKIVKREGPPVYENGDFLFGDSYIDLLDQQDLVDNQILLLINFAYFGPSALKKLGCFSLDNIETFIEEVSYECPFVGGIKFLGLYPVAILSKDISKYRSQALSGSYYDMAFDSDWTKKMSCVDYDRDKNKILKIPICQIGKAYLGHGYTTYALPDDGRNSIMMVKVPLSNGDWLVCATWVWYNK